MLDNLNMWLEHWYPLLWSIVFLIEMNVGIAVLTMAVKEYKYDEAKDLRKKTRTTKKVTESKDGAKITEETTEVSEGGSNEKVEEKS